LSHGPPLVPPLVGVVSGVEESTGTLVAAWLLPGVGADVADASAGLDVGNAESGSALHALSIRLSAANSINVRAMRTCADTVENITGLSFCLPSRLFAVIICLLNYKAQGLI
jgi:hypothetical protein